MELMSSLSETEYIKIVYFFLSPAPFALPVDETGFGITAGFFFLPERTTESPGSEDFSFFFIPGCARLDDPLRARLKNAPLVFFDGTLYTNDEMIKQGLMNKTGERIGHMNMSGEGGTVEQFAPLNVARKIFIHINNSNPVLRDDSPERAAVERAGWEVAYDGMEVRV